MRDFNFRGQYSKYAKFMTTPIESKERTFTIMPRLIDVYLFSAVYGYLNNAIEEYDPKYEDEADKDDTSTIKQITFINDRKYPILRRIILLNEKITDRSSSERIDSVFRYDYKDVNNSLYEENSKIVEAYVLGGLHKVYEKFKNVRDIETCAKLMYDMVHEFADEVNIEKPDE